MAGTERQRVPSKKSVEKIKLMLSELKTLGVVSNKQFANISFRLKSPIDILDALLEIGVLKKTVKRKNKDDDANEKIAFYVWVEKFRVTYALVNEIMENRRLKLFELLNANTKKNVIISTSGRKPATIVPKRVCTPVFFRRDIPVDKNPVIQEIIREKKTSAITDNISEKRIGNYVNFLKAISSVGCFSLKQFNKKYQKQYSIPVNALYILSEMKFLRKSGKPVMFSYTGIIPPEPITARRLIEIINAYNEKRRLKNKKRVDEKTIRDENETNHFFLQNESSSLSEVLADEKNNILYKPETPVDESKNTPPPQIISPMPITHFTGNAPFADGNHSKRTWRNFWRKLWGFLKNKS